MEQLPPCRFAFDESQFVRERIGGRNARAGQAVVEAQHPNPAAVEDVVQRRVVRRVRRRFGRRMKLVPPVDAFEVRIERLRRGEGGERCFAELQRAMQKTSRAAGVDHKLRAQREWTAIVLRGEFDTESEKRTLLRLVSSRNSTPSSCAWRTRK